VLALYHFGDAICAKKVRLALAEKGLAWESRDCIGAALRDPEYLKLNPSGVVPTLVHDDKVLTESRIISEYIDDAFEGPALMPSDPHGRHRARYWMKQIDDSLHLNVFILTFAGSAREMFLHMPPDARAPSLPGLRDPIKRRISIELLDEGWESPLVAAAVDRFRRLLREMENCLALSAYLAGPGYSLADADYTAYIDRLVTLGLEGLWTDKAPVQDWWARMQERPSYKTALIDWAAPQDAARYKNFRERYADSLRGLVQAA
jgi:glutathione S-transferase